MAALGALVKGKGMAAAGGVYVERRDLREPALEEWLRGLLARLPRLPRRRQPWAAVVTAAGALEPCLRAMNDTELKAFFRAACVAMRGQGFADALVARSFAAVRE